MHRMERESVPKLTSLYNVKKIGERIVNIFPYTTRYVYATLVTKGAVARWSYCWSEWLTITNSFDP
jgi:hypothetical protein